MGNLIDTFTIVSAKRQGYGRGMYRGCM